MMMRFIPALFALMLSGLPLRAEVDVQEITTPGGIGLWLVEDHSLPIIALEMRFRGGASLDPADKSGATNLMSALLEEGAGELDSRGFSRALEDLATSIGYRTTTDALSVSARFLSETRDASMALLRDSLIHPRFDADAIERVRAQVLSSIRSDMKDPHSIAGRRFQEIAFGDHPYARSTDGTLETVAALSREDLLAAHAGALARDRLLISIVGDVSPDEAAAMVDDLVAELPENGAPMPGPAEVKLTEGVTVVDFDTPQSVAIFGQRGIGLDDPDFFAAYILDLILGGGSFESRLMQEVREKRGLTYGISTWLMRRDLANLWMGTVASANGRIAETVEVIRAEWQRARDKGVSDEELANAKTYLTGSYPLRFDGISSIADILVGMQMQGMPADYIKTRNDRVNAVTKEDIARVAKRLLDPSNLRFVVVGRPEGLQEVE